jgi:hypothetical protein
MEFLRYFETNDIFLSLNLLLSEVKSYELTKSEGYQHELTENY